MIVYNQESYVEDAINGVLMQKTNFEIELIIADDCSTDKTDFKIREAIALRSSSRNIKYFRHDHNMGMMPNFIFALKRCQGQYIALCEGDDFWIDVNKLQKQVNYLDTNIDTVLCFHEVKVLMKNKKLVKDFITKVPKQYENIEDLARFGNYIHTPSVVFRNVLEEYPFEFEQVPFGDYFLYMMLAQNGKLHFMKDCMSVYRYHVGILSEMNNNDILIKSVKLYSCMISYFTDKNLKKILFEKQIGVATYYNKLINDGYRKPLIYSYRFEKLIRFLKLNYRSPKELMKKTINKLFNLKNES
ncbi:glycosyltransferase family 2 protein [Hanstruepera marina]|uniref:glycosyltransferase family 2 protein n=1 Tax=Hanstruepera marina TaxID=2873265 RepID=UPI001CA7985B|nr:glycosyltransferase [Hanstruepera marina]